MRQTCLHKPNGLPLQMVHNHHKSVASHKRHNLSKPRQTLRLRMPSDFPAVNVRVEYRSHRDVQGVPTSCHANRRNRSSDKQASDVIG